MLLQSFGHYGLDAGAGKQVRGAGVYERAKANEDVRCQPGCGFHGDFLAISHLL